jgi:hypothetical protein
MLKKVLRVEPYTDNVEKIVYSGGGVGFRGANKAMPYTQMTPEEELLATPEQRVQRYLNIPAVEELPAKKGS